MWKTSSFISATQPETIHTRQNKEIKYNYDESSKSYLTRTYNKSPNDYKSQNRVYHGKSLTVDKKHQEIDKGIHQLMKTTTYKIGQQFNEKQSSNQEQYDKKSNDEVNNRRADPSNPNRIMTVGFGFGAEKGTKEHQVEHRARTYYNHYFKEVKNDMSPEIA